jgi:methionyl-tRNA formyltransferase
LLTSAVPIKKVATEELELPTHIIDTFTGWTPPIQYNLIIAVSFGLFVPPRILNLAEYKGLNVHPSLLPDLHGAAPIHQTIMKRRPFTGLTVQTLHPEKFDGGTILAQSPKPGIECSKETNLAELTTLLADKGGDMLVKVLKTGAFVPPLKDVGWYAQSGGPIEHAEKIEKKHWHIDFSKSTMDEITTIVRAGGVPWTTLENNTRVLLHHIWPTNYTCPENVPTGIWHPDISHVFVNREATPKRSLMARAACGGIMQIKNVTIDGGKANGGYDRFKKLYGKKHVYLWERGQPTPTYGKHKLTPRGMEELNMPPYKPTGGLLNKHIRERKSAG